MKRSLSLLAASALFATAIPAGFAAPEDWVGKELPPLNVDFLSAKPETKGRPAIVEFWAT